MDAARRERRHHRKAAVGAAAAGAGGVGGVGGGAAAAARAAYGDVFGGPPRFAAPFGGAPLDYAEVFGGVAATCSIPYLDLPPAPTGGGAGAGGFFACRGKGDYGEIFGRFDFADFALPYEDLFGAPQPEPVPEAAREADPEIASSSSGSSTSRSVLRALPPSLCSDICCLPVCLCFRRGEQCTRPVLLSRFGRSSFADVDLKDGHEWGSRFAFSIRKCDCVTS
jgi:hypothetical protein